MRIAIISSSTRTGRMSHRVSLALHALIAQRNANEVDMIDLISFDIPLFDEVLAKHPNPPADLIEISKRLQKADAILFVSPEYNGSYSPALKNLVDYLGKAEFSKKAIGIVSVSNGVLAGMRGALQMQQLVLAMFGFPLPQMLLVPQVHLKFEESGTVIDAEFAKKMDGFLNEYLWFAEAIVKAKSV